MPADPHIDQIRPVTPSARGCEDCLKIGRPLGASAAVPDLRARRLLRLVEEQARARPLPRDEAPDRPVLRAGRGLALVLRRRGVPVTPALLAALARGRADAFARSPACRRRALGRRRDRARRHRLGRADRARLRPRHDRRAAVARRRGRLRRCPARSSGNGPARSAWTRRAGGARRSRSATPAASTARRSRSSIVRPNSPRPMRPLTAELRQEPAPAQVRLRP